MKRKKALLITITVVILMSVVAVSAFLLSNNKKFDSVNLTYNINKSQGIHEYFRGVGMGLMAAKYDDKSGDKKRTEAIMNSVKLIDSYFKYIDTEYKFNDYTYKGKDDIFNKHIESILLLKSQNNEIKNLNDKLIKKSKDLKFLLDNIESLSTKANLYMSTCAKIYNTGLYTLIKEDKSYSFSPDVSDEQIASMNLIPYKKLNTALNNTERQKQLDILKSRIN